MKVYQAPFPGWEYWYDPATGQRFWYAAKYDASGNQVGESINAHGEKDIIDLIALKNL